MKKFIQNRPLLRRIVYFFPLQLLLVQVKKNHMIVVFWLLLFGFITESVAARYGVGFLFLEPEYMEKVSFLSYFIVGFSCGGFIMAYNISCYIQNAFRFPFLATLSHPFIKFCWNNFIIPVFFLAVYFNKMFSFFAKESIAAGDQFVYISAFLAGLITFMSISFFYFIRTNKDISKIYGIRKSEDEKKRRYISRIILRRNFEWRNLDANREARDWHVEVYINFPWRIKLARSFEHYDKEMLIRVFKQNHYNAVFFQALVLISLLVLGSFRDIPAFMIPAGASVFLLFTMYLMMTSMLHTWFRGWTTTVFILLLISFNWAYQFDYFSNHTRAYGMDYTVPPVKYTNEKLHYYDQEKNWRAIDSANTIATLENWKARNMTDSTQLPKLVIFNCSGGGIRSALWTLYTMQYGDSVTGDLLSHTAAVFGSSGGMLGAAYLREVKLRGESDPKYNYRDPALRDHVSADILNPMAFSIAVNDWFLPIQRFKLDSQHYGKNRAYAFEEKFNDNTGRILTKRLEDYAADEASARIPMMVFSPTIVNDGRRLVISAQGVSYLTQSREHDRISYNKIPDGIEYSRFFSEQKAGRILFSSVLRMSATFPYITPLTELPSDPKLEVFDAGMRDNYGLVNTIRFIYCFREWLEKNTSGVVIIQTRDKFKERPVEPDEGQTLSEALSRPLGSFYGNLFTVQDYNTDREFEYAQSWFKSSIDIIDFELQNEFPDRISLSWHLTNAEKKKVINSMKSAKNKENIERLKKLMREN
ncbi:MAG: hypothetical protein FD123_2267 [Bacteroidetes bacterium]|nr:MAG: hypothetical protein FD123_2267 [Bacteroidota bacterium]